MFHIALFYDSYSPPSESYSSEVSACQALARDSSGDDIVILTVYFTFRVMVTSTESSVRLNVCVRGGGGEAEAGGA